MHMVRDREADRARYPWQCHSGRAAPARVRDARGAFIFSSWVEHRWIGNDGRKIFRVRTAEGRGSLSSVKRSIKSQGDELKKNSQSIGAAEPVLLNSPIGDRL